MAENDSTLSNTTKARAVKFTACGGDLYQLQDTASVLDIKNQLSARLHQLTAMLSMVTGEDFETFNNNSDANKENFLWGCSMLAEECRELARYVDKTTSDKPMQNAEESRAGAMACMDALRAIERITEIENKGDSSMDAWWTMQDDCAKAMLNAAGNPGTFMTGFISVFAEYAFTLNNSGHPALDQWKPEATMTNEEQAAHRAAFTKRVEEGEKIAA